MPPPSIVKPHVRPPARGGSRPAAMTTKRPAAALPKSAASKPATLPVIVKKPTNLATPPDVVNPNKRAAATVKKVDDKHKSTVLIGLVTTTSMGCCPSSWLEEVDVFLNVNPRSSSKDSRVFRKIRNEILEQSGNQLSKIQLASFVLADYMHECQKLITLGKQSLHIILTTCCRGQDSATQGTFPGSEQDLATKLRRVALQRTGLRDNFSFESFLSIYSLNKARRDIDHVILFLDVDTTYIMISEAQSMLPSLTRTVPCSFIMFSDMLPSEKLQKVQTVFNYIVKGTASQFLLISNPNDCQSLSQLLVSMSLRKTKFKREFLRPNAVDVHFGSMSPLAIMVQPVHLSKKKYVKPDGAGRVSIIGFIEEEEAIIRGFGFHRRFDLLDAYQEPCFKQRHSSYDPRSIKRNRILFDLLNRCLLMTGTAAYCILYQKGKTKKPSYGFIHLILGMLKDGFVGCETWNTRLEWIVKTKDYKMPPFNRIPLQLSLEQCWLDQSTMAKFTTTRLHRLVSGTMKPAEFAMLVDELIDHSRTIGMSMKWLVEGLKYCRKESKSAESAQAVEAAMKNVEAVEKKWRASG